MTPKEMIAVIKAFDEGKKIEALDRADGDWFGVSNPQFNFSDFDYRIKREPKVIYVNEYGDGRHRAYDTSLAANGGGACAVRKAVKYTEVIED